MWGQILVASAALIYLAAAQFVAHPGSIAVARQCPLQVTKVTLEPGTGFDRDSLYASFFIINGTEQEYLYTYKLQLQLRGNEKQSDVREQVGSTPILPHTKGWYREFVGVELAKPASYSLQQTIISCVSTGS